MVEVLVRTMNNMKPEEIKTTYLIREDLYISHTELSCGGWSFALENANEKVILDDISYDDLEMLSKFFKIIKEKHEAQA